MTNTIISYAKLSKDLKVAFGDWLRLKAPDLISFPFRGKHMKGYIFNHESCNYLIVMASAHDEMTYDINDAEIVDLNEEF